MPEKTCLGCGETFDVDKFAKWFSKKRQKIVVKPRCVECNRKKVREYGHYNHANYGMTIAQAALMATDCEVCGSTRMLSFDHDHKTGDVRGRLCVNCNMGIGHFKDDPSRMEKAIAYLLKASTQVPYNKRENPGFLRRDFKRKLTDAEILSLRMKWGNGARQCDLAREYKLDQGYVSQVVHGKRRNRKQPFIV